MTFGINTDAVFAFAGILLMVMGIIRFFIIKNAANNRTEIIKSDDLIMKYLKQDCILYAQMIEAYSSDYCKLIYGENDGVLLYDERMDYYLASAKTKNGAFDIIRKVKSCAALICFDEVLYEEVEKKLHYNSIFEAYNVLYQKDSGFNINSSAEVKMLDNSYLNIIKQNYPIKQYANDEYLLGVINRGMIGVFVNNELAGFIGTHANNALGLLHVLEKYRNQHLGTLLLASYINYLKNKKYKGPLYGYIEKNNTASLNLCFKLGFTRSKHTVKWYMS